MIVWQYFFPYSTPQSNEENQEQLIENSKPNTKIKQEKITTKVSTSLPTEYVIETTKQERKEFENSKIKGSINPVGLKIDNLALKNFQDFNLLHPSESKNVYFAQFGFASNQEGLMLPTNQTIWKLEEVNNTIVATWKNPQNITFEVLFMLDENYMFDIHQRIYNSSGKDISISAFARIVRDAGDELENAYISHEGFIGNFDSKFSEIKYSKLESVRRLFFPNQTEIVWSGFVDKYWLTAFFYANQVCFGECDFIKSDISLNAVKENDSYKFQTDIITSEVVVKSNNYAYFPIKFFGGVKELKVLDKYESTGFEINGKNYPLKNLETAIDYGVLYFLTKFFLIVITFINSFVHNFGFSIILFTLFVKTLLYPIAKKSYVSMAKMKMIAPEIEYIKKTVEDKMERNRRIMSAYKAKNVNPLAGCLPVVMQIPIFFALYKVLFISIEMKGAPFILWIKDLSMKDPTSFVNLFGLLPFNVPTFLQIGILPILLGLTTYLQQKFSPKTSIDETQLMLMRMMPILLIFIFASFPAGIVLYWIANNIISILQQMYVEKIIIPKSHIIFQKRLKEGK